MDKDDIVKLAREIGTYEVSISHDVKCPFVPGRPKTKGRWDEFTKVAMKVGAEDLLRTC